MEYKQYKLGELFDVENTWTYGKNKQYITRTERPTTASSLPVVSGQTINNGIRYYTDDKVVDDEKHRDCLTISTRGYSGVPFYHDYEFVLANNILTMPMPNISVGAQLYIAACISKLPYGDAYSNYPTKDTLAEDSILLPVDANGTPDWQYMEDAVDAYKKQYIANENRRAEDEYKKKQALADVSSTAISDDEEEFIADFIEGRNQEWGTIKYSTLFTLKSVSKVPSQYGSGNTPVHSAQKENNGIKGYCDLEPSVKTTEDVPAYLLFGDHTRSFHIEHNDFCIADNVKVLEPKRIFTDNILLYIIVAWEKQITDLGYARHWKIAMDADIPIPLKTMHNDDDMIDIDDIDFDAIERYIDILKRKKIEQSYQDRKAQLKEMANI